MFGIYHRMRFRCALGYPSCNIVQNFLSCSTFTTDTLND